MYNILIVDDEPMHRRVLSEMIRGLAPDYSVYQAKNGKEALDLVISGKADIILTDIKMPVMDGFQLIEAVREKQLSPLIVLLTGYGQFEYAKKAVSLGVFDYILKPFDVEAIRKLLENSTAHIDRERMRSRETDTIRKQMEAIYPVYIEHLVNCWLNGTLLKSEIAELEVYFPGDKRGFTVLAELEEAEKLNSSYTEDELYEIKSNIKLWLNEILEKFGRPALIFMEDNKYMIAGILVVGFQREYSGEALKRELTGFIDAMRNDYGLNITIGVGNPCEEVYGEMKGSCLQAKEALEYKFYYGNGRAIFIYDIESGCRDKNNKELLHYISRCGQDLAEALQHDEKENLLKIAGGFFTKLGGFPYPKPGILFEALTHMIMDVSKVIEDFMPAGMYYVLVQEITDLSGCTSLDMLRQRVTDSISRIYNTYSDIRNNKEKSILQQCVQYIEEHHAEDLSLEAVAERFHFNSSYFSSYFRNNTGVNFTDYLLKVRMKKVKQLLENSRKQVNQIALEAGYKNVRYFNRVFKKEFHMTPYEYRRMVGK